MGNNLENMLSYLPSGQNFARNINISEANALGIHPSGDTDKGCELYKFLSSEGYMFSYLLVGDTLIFSGKQKIFDAKNIGNN